MSASTTDRLVALAVLSALLAGCGGPAPRDTGDPRIDTARPRPEARWSLDLGRGIEFAPVGVPDGWVVTATQGQVLRLDRSTGDIRWRRKLPAPPASAPVTVSGRVVVATDLPAEQVLGLDEETGEILWRHVAESARLVARPGVLVALARRGVVTRLDADDGRRVWVQRLAGAGWRDPVLTERHLLIPVRPDSVVALLIEDGSRVWARPVGAWPQIDCREGGCTAVTDDSSLVAFREFDGEILGRRRLSSMPAGPPVMSASGRFVALRNGEVLSIDPATLDTIWSRRLDPPLVSAPRIDGDDLFQAGSSGIVHLLNRADGAERARYHHPELIRARPGLDPESLVVPGDRGRLVAFRRES